MAVNFSTVYHLPSKSLVCRGCTGLLAAGAALGMGCAVCVRLVKSDRWAAVCGKSRSCLLK